MLRRAFLLLLTGLAIAPSIAQAQSIVFVVRHAERADEPARDQENPPLSAAGAARAGKLREILQDAGIKGIYVSQYRRTQDTAAPLASKLKIKPDVVPASVPAFVSTMKANHASDPVLVVGHTSTIPTIIKALTGISVDIPESDYTSLFVVVPATRTVTKLRF